MWGEEKFLDHMKAEIVTVEDSDVTCLGAHNEKGGNNIDYFRISKKC